MAVPAPFALTPGLQHTAPYNFTVDKDVKLYRAAIKSLFPENERFDCNPEALKDFLDVLRVRVDAYGLEDIMLIPEDPADPFGYTIDMLTNYGLVTMEQVIAAANSYVSTNTRAAQNSMALFMCLMETLSREGRNKVTINKDI